MACVCRGKNVQSDWLIVTELKGIILTYICNAHSLITGLCAHYRM